MRFGATIAILALMSSLAGCKSPASRAPSMTPADIYSPEFSQVTTFCTSSQLTCAPYCFLNLGQGCYSGVKDQPVYRCTCPKLIPASISDKAIIIKAQHMCVEAVTDCPKYCKTDATSEFCAKDGHPTVECDCPPLKMQGD